MIGFIKENIMESQEQSYNKEKNYNQQIESAIKNKFLTATPSIKSEKQLNHYLLRNKTSADKHTAKRFEQYLAKFQLNEIFQQSISDNPISKADYQNIIKQLDKIKIEVKPDKSQVVLDQLISIYEKHIDRFQNGEAVQFKKPWTDNIVFGHPRNIATGQKYNGSNAYLLEMLQQELGLPLPVWLNRSNIEELGLQEPAKPMAVCQKMVELYVNNSLDANHPDKWISVKKYRELSATDQEDYEQKKVMRQFPLYSPSQFGQELDDHPLYQKWLNKHFSKEVELLNKLKNCQTEEQKKKLFEPKILAAKAFADAARKQLGVGLVEHPSSCHYSPTQDQISMVGEQYFKNSNPELAYLGVLFHELSHSTGHEKRLARNLSGKFGSLSYSKEEVVAESAAQQIMMRFNLPNTSLATKQSASYVYSWLKAQKQKQKRGTDFLKIGCSQGKSAADFILTSGREYQHELVQKLDIDHFSNSVLATKDYNQIEPDRLIEAEWINTVAMFHLDDFLQSEFSNLDETQLLTVTGELMSSSNKQFNLTEQFNQYLKKQAGFGITQASLAGKLCKKYGLSDIFDNGINSDFHERSVIARFDRDFGRDKVADYLMTYEDKKAPFKAPAHIVEQLAKLTDKPFLLSSVDTVKPRNKSNNRHSI